MIFSRPKCPLKRRSSLKNSVENYHVFPKKIFKRCPKTTYTIRSRFLSSSQQLKNPCSRVPKVTQVFLVILLWPIWKYRQTTKFVRVNRSKWWKIDQMYDTLWSKNVYESMFSVSIYKYWLTKTYSFLTKESI